MRRPLPWKSFCAQTFIKTVSQLISLTSSSSTVIHKHESISEIRVWLPKLQSNSSPLSSTAFVQPQRLSHYPEDYFYTGKTKKLLTVSVTATLKTCWLLSFFTILSLCLSFKLPPGSKVLLLPICIPPLLECVRHQIMLYTNTIFQI